MVSNVRRFYGVRTALPCGSDYVSPGPIDLAGSRPHATDRSTSTIANRSVISPDNSSR
jgi:hypothetical protein